MQALFDRIKDFYRNYDSSDLKLVRELYAERASFKDPVHKICGADKIESYFSAGKQGLLSCKFAYGEELVHDHKAFLEWEMHFAHRQFRSGSTIVVPGCSYFHSDGHQIVTHTDYFDLGVLLYENVPVLGTVVRQVKKKMMSA